MLPFAFYVYSFYNLGAGREGRRNTRDKDRGGDTSCGRQSWRITELRQAAQLPVGGDAAV